MLDWLAAKLGYERARPPAPIEVALIASQRRLWDEGIEVRRIMRPKPDAVAVNVFRTPFGEIDLDDVAAVWERQQLVRAIENGWQPRGDDD